MISASLLVAFLEFLAFVLGRSAVGMNVHVPPVQLPVCTGYVAIAWLGADFVGIVRGNLLRWRSVGTRIGGEIRYRHGLGSTPALYSFQI